MKIILKYLEIGFFTILNVVFGSVFVAYYTCIQIIFPVLKIVGINIEKLFLNGQEIIMVMIAIFLYVSYILLKLFLFPLLYKNENIFPNIHRFFDLYENNKRVKNIVILIVIIFPLVDWLIYKDVIIMLCQIFMGYGALPGYLMMNRFLKK